MRRHVVTATTASDGSCTVYSPRLFGRIHQIEYVKGDFADGVDFAITGEATGIGLWTQTNVNASAVVAPRQPTHSPLGAARLFASAGEAVGDKIALAADRVKIVIAQGGNAKSGTFHILVD